MAVPPPSAASSQRSILPPAISMRVPVVSSAERVSSSSRETEAIEGSASPRKPSVEMESRSLTSRSLLVAWRSKASSASSRNMPQPSSDDADQPPPAGFHFDAQVRRAGVERVLQQLLDHRSRPLHHFAGGDLIGDLVGKNADAAHDAHYSPVALLSSANLAADAVGGLAGG